MSVPVVVWAGAGAPPSTNPAARAATAMRIVILSLLEPASRGTNVKAAIPADMRWGRVRMADASGGHVAEGAKSSSPRETRAGPAPSKSPGSSGARVRLSRRTRCRSGSLLVGAVLGQLGQKLIGLL